MMTLIKQDISKNINDYGIDTKNRLKVLKVISPPERGGEVKLFTESDQLLETLKDKEGII